jgi:class 3 adenylate cyclase
VSAEVLREVRRTGGSELSQAAPLGPVTVKGRDEPVELYRLA